MKKLMSYASESNIPFVALVGENEIQNHTISLKNMQTGEQKSVSLEEAIAIINQ
jgi:histidyl-tRNA synthetase